MPSNANRAVYFESLTAADLWLKRACNSNHSAKLLHLISHTDVSRGTVAADKICAPGSFNFHHEFISMSDCTHGMQL